MTTTTNTTTTKKATRPEGLSLNQWNRATYAAYMGLLSLVERKTTIARYLKDNAALFLACGIPADEGHVLSLCIAMAKDATVDHQKVRKVLSIGSLRSFFNRTWAEKDALPISYKAPTAPKESKPRTAKAKAPRTTEEQMDAATKWFSKMTADEQGKFLAKLLGEAA